MAGLWQPWRAPTGEWVDTFTMLTLNSDDHELMKHVNGPDPKRPPDLQDKRMVTVILPDGLYETWVDAPAANSEDFIRQHPADRLLATAEPLALKTMRPTPAPSVQGELL